jgi:hypothetical protein
MLFASENFLYIISILHLVVSAVSCPFSFFSVRIHAFTFSWLKMSVFFAIRFSMQLLFSLSRLFFQMLFSAKIRVFSIACSASNL